MDCSGTIGSFESGRADIQKMVQPDFRALGQTDATASLVFRSITCARATMGSLIVDAPITTLTVFARVEPTNSSWDTPHSSLFSILSLATNETVASTLTSEGIQTIEATFTKSEYASGDDTLTSAKYVYNNASRLEHEALATAGDSGNLMDHAFALWHETTNGFKRVDMWVQAGIDDPPIYQGTIRHHGSNTQLGGWAAAKVCCSTWVGQSVNHGLETWTTGAEFPKSSD